MCLERTRTPTEVPVAGRDTKLRSPEHKARLGIHMQIHTHQYETSHSWLEVLAGGRGPQDVFHHLDTQTPRFRGTWRQDVGRLTAREAARPTRGNHCNWLRYGVVWKDKTQWWNVKIQAVGYCSYRILDLRHIALTCARNITDETERRETSSLNRKCISYPYDDSYRAV
jgi:hypothetical protein